MIDQFFINFFNLLSFVSYMLSFFFLNCFYPFFFWSRGEISIVSEIVSSQGEIWRIRRTKVFFFLKISFFEKKKCTLKRYRCSISKFSTLSFFIFPPSFFFFGAMKVLGSEIDL